MKHKILLFLASISISMASFAQYVDGGMAGPLSWEVTGTAPNYTLTIGGEGAMPNYEFLGPYAPWYPYREYIVSVEIGNGVTTIGHCAFLRFSSLPSITIPNSVTTLGNTVFRECSGLTSITIGESITTIGQSVFYDCSSLFSVTIPNSVTSIGNYAFKGCSSLTSVTIGESVTTIGEYGFWQCGSLASVIIPNSVTVIGQWAFRECSSLSSVIIGESVTTIGISAFYQCIGLTAVTIGKKVTSIKEYAFAHCSGLTSITTLATTPPSLLTSAFMNVPSTIPVYIPCGSYDAYNGSSWSSYFDNFVEDCFTPVINIDDLPTSAITGVPLTLTGAVEPPDATCQTIIWSIKDAGTTGATISGAIFTATAAGTATVTATIENGTAAGINYTQDFNIAVSDPFIPVTNITNLPDTATANIPLSLTGTVEPGDATNQIIVWTLKDAGATHAIINGNTFTATAAGTATIVATIENGTAQGTDYTQEFSIEVTSDIGITETQCIASPRVYPNPATDFFVIDIDGVASVKLYDMSGKEVLTQTANGKTGISISRLPNGVYHILVFSEEKVIGNSKVVKR